MRDAKQKMEDLKKKRQEIEGEVNSKLKGDKAKDKKESIIKKIEEEYKEDIKEMILRTIKSKHNQAKNKLMFKKL